MSDPVRIRYVTAQDVGELIALSRSVQTCLAVDILLYHLWYIAGHYWQQWVLRSSPR